MILSLTAPNIGLDRPDSLENIVNTPTHMLLSIAALTRNDGEGKSQMLPATVGAVLPDAPMFFFYAVEKFILESSEREIWTTRYFLPAWQDFFDVFNSAPIVCVGLFLAWRLRSVAWTVLFASMLLHIACDLPVHHDDGHRHFWPLTDWRFESPISYWDPNHFGRPAAISELGLLIGCYVASMIRHKRFGIRLGITLIVLVQCAFFVFAILMWAGQSPDAAGTVPH